MALTFIVPGFSGWPTIFPAALGPGPSLASKEKGRATDGAFVKLAHLLRTQQSSAFAWVVLPVWLYEAHCWEPQAPFYFETVSHFLVRLPGQPKGS